MVLAARSGHTRAEPRRGVNISAQGKRSAALGAVIRRREALKGRNSRWRIGTVTFQDEPQHYSDGAESGTIVDRRGTDPFLSRPFRAWYLRSFLPRAALRLSRADMSRPFRAWYLGSFLPRAARSLALG
jgi:hypothetical protein